MCMWVILVLLSVHGPFGERQIVRTQGAETPSELVWPSPARGLELAFLEPNAWLDARAATRNLALLPAGPRPDDRVHALFCVASALPSPVGP